VGGLLVEELAAEPVGDLLDVGTGAGFLLKTLAPAASKAVGVDSSTDALRLARSQVHLRECRAIHPASRCCANRRQCVEIGLETLMVDSNACARYAHSLLIIFASFFNQP
jgi:tRNA A58 N-methylase Trm61